MNTAVNDLQTVLDCSCNDNVKPTVSADHKTKVISRSFDAMSEDAKEKLLTNLDNTIEIYKKAKGM